ncbi:MAG: ABC transporter ATP-binding protein [Sedimentisphaeraceae bacterium JB056]
MQHCSENVIELKDLYKSYRLGKNDVPVLKGINFTVKKGEYVGVMGASGSGKTTFLNLLGLLDLPSEGSYLLEGVQTNSLGDRELARLRNKRIGFIFQNFNLFGYLSVRQNIEVPLVYGNVARSQRKEVAEELAEKLGLSHRLKHLPGELSGGERQRVAIARALSTKPAFLLADEPTGNLDEKTGEDVLELFEQLHTEVGTTIVFVTHNPNYESYFHKVMHLRDGVLEQADENK